MKTFSIKEALKKGWDLFKNHRNLLLFSTLIMLGINGVQNSRSHDNFNNFSFNSFGLFFGLLIFVVVNMLHIGWMKMLLKISDGEYTSLKEMIKHANLFIKFVLVMIAYSLLVFVGMILLVIPGIYFAMKYMFAPIIAIDMHLDFKETFKESARITNGVKWKLVGFVLVLIGVNILGACALLVGLLISVPVSTLAFIHVYRKLANTSIAEITTPIATTAWAK